MNHLPIAPNFLKIQTESFHKFLKKGLIEQCPKEIVIPCPQTGSIVKIRFYAHHYKLQRPKLSLKQAILKKRTYAAGIMMPIKIDNGKGENKLDWFSLGHIPLMTKNGHFIVNGSARLILNQIVRSPGVYFKKHTGLKNNVFYTADLIAERGTWLRFETDNKRKQIWVKMKKQPKLPMMAFLRCMGLPTSILQLYLRDKDEISLQQVETNQITTCESKAFNTLWSILHPLALTSNMPSIPADGGRYAVQMFLYRRFFHKYRLSKAGRRHINEKLGTNISINYPFLTPYDMLLTCFHLLQCVNENVTMSDIDDLQNRLIKTSGLLIKDQWHLSMIQLEDNIRTILSMETAMGLNKKDPNRMPLEKMFNPKIIDSIVNQFFATNPLSQLLDQTNSLAELTHKRRLSSLGIGGINRQNAGMAVRGIHPSHYGRICPIETPEGQNAGLVNSLTVYASLEQGHLQTGFYKSHKGFVLLDQKPKIFTSQQEKEFMIAPGDLHLNCLNILPKASIPARQSASFKKVNRIKLDYVGLQPTQMMSLATSCIPFVEHDDGNRALMGSNMQRQAVPLIRPTRPIVGTGLEARVIADIGESIECKQAGIISYVDSQQIQIYSSMQETAMTKRPIRFKRHRLQNTRNLNSSEIENKTVFGLGLNTIENKYQNKRTSIIKKALLLPQWNNNEYTKFFLTKYNNPIETIKQCFKHPKRLMASSHHKKAWMHKVVKGSVNASAISWIAYSQWYLNNQMGNERNKKQWKGQTNNLINSKWTGWPQISYTKLTGSSLFVKQHIFNKRFRNPTNRPDWNWTNGKELGNNNNRRKWGFSVLLNENVSYLNGPHTLQKQLISLLITDDLAKLFDLDLETDTQQVKAQMPYRPLLPPCVSQPKDKKYNRNGCTETIDQSLINEKEVYTDTEPHLLKRHTYSLNTWFRSNQDTYSVHRPCTYGGQWVDKGDCLADTSSSDKGELAVGRNLLIGYMPWEGYNFEDAILLNKRLVTEDILTSLHIERYETNVQQTALGPEKLTNEYAPDYLDANGVVTVGTWVTEGDILVGKRCPIKPRRLSNYEKLLYDLIERKAPTTRDTSLRVPTDMEGRVIHVDYIYANKKKKMATSGHANLADPTLNTMFKPMEQNDFLRSNKKNTMIGNLWHRKSKHLSNLDCEIESVSPQNNNIQTIYIYIAEKRKIQVGDKMAGRHGNKGIISKLLPEQDMPYLPDGTPLDVVLNPLGIPSRMNVGQIFECLLGLAGYYLNQTYRIQPFDEMYGPEASRSLVYSKLYEARLKTGNQWLFQPNFPGKVRLFDGRTGQCFQQPVTIGKAYMLKLIHQVDDKIHARSIGPYSLVTQQPLRGRSKRGGQRVGEMEVWAFEGFGAAYILQELLTIKSDDMVGRKSIWKHFIKNKPLKFTLPESFNVLMRELQALCLNVSIYQQIGQTKMEPWEELFRV